MLFSVYVIQSRTTGKIYIGQTSDLLKRVDQHNDPDCMLTLHTKRNVGPWNLIHHEEYPSRKEAMKREKTLKSGKGREWLYQNILKHKSLK